MMKTAYKILIGAGAAAAGIAATATLSYTITKKMMKIALDRQPSKIPERAQRRVSGTKNQGKNRQELALAADRLRNSECETVEITAHDGIRLIGHWQPCENAERVIIAMHGWRSSWYKDFGMISDFWRENHCSVLYVEQRAQGESEGEYMGFGLIERYDCLDWIRWANAHGCSRLPIYLCGVSMGASTVLMAAGLELPENVHGVMADCGYTSAHDIWKHVVKHNLHISYGGITASIASDICKKKINCGPKEYSCVEAMRNCKVPVLFVHGTDDHFVPIEMTYENYKACAAPKRLLVVPGAEHGMSYVLEKKNYEECVKRFWQDFD